MKRVAFISYDYSVQNAGGSLRAIGFARHLPESGWTPIVITSSPAAEHPNLGQVAARFVESTERKMSGGIKTHQGAGNLRSPSGLLKILTPVKKLLPVERQLLWLPRLRKSLKTNPLADVEVVLTTVAPYTSLIAGHLLSQRLGVPHVVDLRDDWIDRFRIEKTSWISRTLLDKLMVSLLRRAAAVVVVSPVTQQRLQSIGIEAHVVYNGYEEADFSDVPLRASSVPVEGPLRLVHAGWLGSYRSPLPLLEAMSSVARDIGMDDTRDSTNRTHPPANEPIENHRQDGQDPFLFCQMGLVDEETSSILARQYPGVRTEVRSHGSHEAARDAMLSADVLVAIPGTAIPAAITGKLFEYLRARRPVLLIAPSGAATELADAANLEFVVDPADHEAISEVLRAMLERKVSGRLRTSGDPALLERYSRRSAALQLGEVLDSVILRSQKKGAADVQD